MIAAPSSADLDCFLDALPSYRLAAPRNPPARFPEWRWPLSKAYQGFSPVERVRGWQMSRWLQGAGSLPYPRRCDVCRGGDHVAFHSASYYHIGRAPALCRACHRAIHLCHARPQEWTGIVHANARIGSEWFVLLPAPSVDLAAHLRSRLGWSAADLVASPISPLPEAVADCLPFNMTQHPRLS